MSDSKDVVPSYPPSDMLRDEVIEVMTDYLKREGALRAPYKPEKGGENKPLPSPAMPGNVHLMLSIFAGHEALPYSGNVTALVRDIVWIGLMAYMRVLDGYSPDDPKTTHAIHIIRQEETQRLARLAEMMSVSGDFENASASILLQLAADSGDLKEIFTQLQRLFEAADQCPSRMLQHLLLQQMYTTPEIRDALSRLDADLSYHVDPEVEIWMQRFDELAEQLEQEA